MWEGLEGRWKSVASKAASSAGLDEIAAMGQAIAGVWRAMYAGGKRAPPQGREVLSKMLKALRQVRAALCSWCS
jgi:hypothetical protein